MAGIKRIYITRNSWGIIVSADIESRTRKNLVHYTRIIIDPKTRQIKKISCSCEGFTFKKRCWHISELLRTINSNKSIKQKIEEITATLH